MDWDLYLSRRDIVWMMLVSFNMQRVVCNCVLRSEGVVSVMMRLHQMNRLIRVMSCPFVIAGAYHVHLPNHAPF